MKVFARHGWRFSNRIDVEFGNFSIFSLDQNFMFEIAWIAVLVL